jgi:asparagine synthase (glutamine-hydrolysing)
VRISHPFLDARLMKFCYTLPRDFKESPAQKKRLLQDAMAARLPEPIRTRRTKRGFNDVYWSGLRASLPRMEAMVEGSRLNELDVFDTDRFVSLLRQHVMGVGGAMTGGRLGRSLALIAWFDGIQDALARPEPKLRVRHPGLCRELVPC